MHPPMLRIGIGDSVASCGAPPRLATARGHTEFRLPYREENRQVVLLRESPTGSQEWIQLFQ